MERRLHPRNPTRIHACWIALSPLDVAASTAKRPTTAIHRVGWVVHCSSADPPLRLAELADARVRDAVTSA
jgi:hypothetical protein